MSINVIAGTYWDVDLEFDPTADELNLLMNSESMLENEDPVPCTVDVDTWYEFHIQFSANYNRLTAWIRPFPFPPDPPQDQLGEYWEKVLDEYDYDFEGVESEEFGLTVAPYGVWNFDDVVIVYAP